MYALICSEISVQLTNLGSYHQNHFTGHPLCHSLDPLFWSRLVNPVIFSFALNMQLSTKGDWVPRAVRDSYVNRSKIQLSEMETTFFTEGKDR